MRHDNVDTSFVFGLAQAYLNLAEVLGCETIVGPDLSAAGQLYRTLLEQRAVTPEPKGLLDSPTGTAGVSSSAGRLAAPEEKIYVYDRLTHLPA